MRVGIGSTRIVLIFSTFVVKIPRIRIFRLFQRTVELRVQSKSLLLEKTANYSKKYRILAIIRYLFIGIIANRMEYHYYQKHKNFKELLPVRLLIFGFLEIQEKGKVIEESSSTWKNLKVLLTKAGVNCIYIFKPENFCIWNESLCILDYADEETFITLEKKVFEIMMILNNPLKAESS